MRSYYAILCAAGHIGLVTIEDGVIIVARRSTVEISFQMSNVSYDLWFMRIDGVRPFDRYFM